MATIDVVPHRDAVPMRLAVREPVARLVGNRTVPRVGLLVVLMAVVVGGVGLLALTSTSAGTHGLTVMPLMLPLTGLVRFPSNRADSTATPRTKH